VSDSENSKSLTRFFLEVAIVFGFIAGLPFIIGGIWPPFVSVVSDSMEPNIDTGDMIYIVDNERYTDSEAYAGVVPKMDEDSSESFDKYGDVIVFQPDGDENKVPVIHRAIMFVEEDEDWSDRGEIEYMDVESCDRLPNCPAPNKGFITHGDANSQYDQVAELSKPVKEEWVKGRATYRVPFLGWIRMLFESVFSIF